MQVIGDWVASHTHEEVLAAMAEARVPSGQSCHQFHCVMSLSKITMTHDIYPCMHMFSKTPDLLVTHQVLRGGNMARTALMVVFGV